MGNITDWLSKIKTAVYGEDVRDAIYNSINDCYNVCTEAEATAESISGLKSEINNKVGSYNDINYTLADGLFNSSTKAIDITGANYRHILCEVTEGTRYHIHGIAAGNKNYSTYAFYDADMNFILSANDIGSNITDYDVFPPNGSVFISINGYARDNKLPYIKKWVPSEYADNISYDSLFKIIGTESSVVNLTENTGKLINSTVVEATNRGGKYAVASCKEENYYLIKGYNWNTMYPLFIFTDGTNKINNVYNYNSSIGAGIYTSFIVKSPKYAKMLYINGRMTDTISCVELSENPLSVKFSEINSKINEISSTKDTFNENLMSRLQIESHKNPFVYADFDKAYISFCFDDGLNDIDYVAKIFDEFGYPCCLAVPPSRINASVSGLSDKSLGTTVKEVMNHVVNQGGEILCHDTPVLTKDNVTDKDFMLQTFVTNKALLENEGFNIRGIILAGGTGYITGQHPVYGNTIDKWVRTNFDYSDLYGNTPEYYYPRKGMNSIEQVKGEIDKAISNKTWKILYTHSVKDASLSDGTSTEDMLRTVLQYCKDNNVEVVPYSYIYDNFGSNSFEERLKDLEV